MATVDSPLDFERPTSLRWLRRIALEDKLCTSPSSYSARQVKFLSPHPDGRQQEIARLDWARLSDIKGAKTMKQASMRTRAYPTISFLLSLLLFHVGTLHNPQGEFIDLDSNELDLRYTTLFFAPNMMTLLG
ncbi:MAG: hypothetical protein HYU58_16705 [Proteobacteria bacterium]|nr:hypothetical protein [Pseudomonadota bacterium]